jgi:hypothetical protein
VDALGNDGNASMPEQFKRPNQWRKIIIIIIIIIIKWKPVTIWEVVEADLNTLSKHTFEVKIRVNVRCINHKGIWRSGGLSTFILNF